MKHNMYPLKALLPMLLAFGLMTSCLKEEQDTFVLPSIHIEKPVNDGGSGSGGSGGGTNPGGGDSGTNTGNPYADSTGHINDTIVPPGLRDSIDDHFDYNEGTNPPNVSGMYVMSIRKMIYHSVQGNTDVNLSDYYFGIIRQNDRYYFVSRGTGGLEYSQAGVSGSGNDFSVCFLVNGKGDDDMSPDAWYKASVVLSGTIEDAGVRNCQYVFTMLEKYDPCGIFMPVGTYYICRDADGLAERRAWF